MCRTKAYELKGYPRPKTGLWWFLFCISIIYHDFGSILGWREWLIHCCSLPPYKTILHLSRWCALDDVPWRLLASHQPFLVANIFISRVINAIALLVTFINAATMALLAVSTVGWSGTIEVTGIYGVVTLMQLMVLLGELRQIFTAVFLGYIL